MTSLSRSWIRRARSGSSACSRDCSSGIVCLIASGMLVAELLGPGVPGVPLEDRRAADQHVGAGEVRADRACRVARRRSAIRGLPKRTPSRAKKGLAWPPCASRGVRSGRGPPMLPPLVGPARHVGTRPAGRTHQWSRAAGTSMPLTGQLDRTRGGPSPSLLGGAVPDAAVPRTREVERPPPTPRCAVVGLLAALRPLLLVALGTRTRARSRRRGGGRTAGAGT